MFDHLFQLTNTHLFVSLVFISVFISAACLYLLRDFLATHLKYKNNAVIGSISALISIIYGVLAGLTALYLINNINSTVDAVQREADSLANIYRASQWLEEPTRTQIKTNVIHYLWENINEDWPNMKKGLPVDSDGEIIIENMANAISDYVALHPEKLFVPRTVLDEVRLLYGAREQRINMSFAALNSEIWVVILIGTILIVAINFLFKLNFNLHLISVCATALMVSSMLFLLITLDRPFRGEFVVESDSFKSVLAFIKDHPKMMHAMPANYLDTFNNTKKE